MIAKDWMREAANEIDGDPGTLNTEAIRNIILKHCPFKPDVAYMPVPRCDGCRHWDNEGMSNQFHGVCRLVEHKPFAIVSCARMVTHARFGCTEWEGK